MAKLTAEEKRHYDEQGYVIPDFRLSPEKLASLRAAVDRVVEGNTHLRPEHLVSVHVVNNRPEGTNGDRSFLDIARDPEVLDLVESAIGPDIILWGAHLFCKPPVDGMEVPMHQDGEYWPIRPLATCSVWIAIDDVTVENGCMRFIPGSHRGKQSLAHTRDDRSDIALSRGVDASQYDAEAAVDIELAAGAMSLHDVYLVHGSNANRSNKRRAGLVLRYMPATSYFDRHLMKPSRSSNINVNFAERPLFLVRGVDRTGRNELDVGLQWVA